MLHKFSVGMAVYYQGAFLSASARGAYKITKQLPVEQDNKVLYRIKNPAEAFERTAEECQLSR